VLERERIERFAIPSDPELICEARKWLIRILDGAGWSDDETHDLSVALSEACSNAHRYAYDGRTDGRIDLRVVLCAKKVELAVRDYGEGFSLLGYRAPDLADPTEGGYGIFLMRNLTDHIEHRPMETGTLVVMLKAKGGAADAPLDDEATGSGDGVQHVR
jgi:serine/threonine-protein kinase RsbW